MHISGPASLVGKHRNEHLLWPFNFKEAFRFAYGDIQQQSAQRSSTNMHHWFPFSNLSVQMQIISLFTVRIYTVYTQYYIYIYIYIHACMYIIFPCFISFTFSAHPQLQAHDLIKPCFSPHIASLPCHHSTVRPAHSLGSSHSSSSMAWRWWHHVGSLLEFPWLHLEVQDGPLWSLDKSDITPINWTYKWE